MIIDRKAPPSDRVAMLLDALAGFDTDAVYLAPEIRDALAQRRAALPTSVSPPA